MSVLSSLASLLGKSSLPWGGEQFRSCYMSAYIQTCLHAYVCICIHVCMQCYMHVDINIYICTDS